jgi:hypothetical protein
VSASYYAGGVPVLLDSAQNQLHFPASQVAGPVNIECIDANNRTEIQVQGFSYGVKVQSISASLLPPSGNPMVYLYASGLKSSSGSVPSVTVGGSAATNVRVFPTDLGGVQAATLNVPNGTAGTASISVSTPNGSGNINNAVRYIPSSVLVPDTGVVQLTYDTHRNLLYALKSTQVEVFDGVSLQPLSPIQLPAVPTGSGPYNEMALSPDGSKLVVLAVNGTYTAGSGVVINPDQPTTFMTFSHNLSGSIAITSDNRAVITGETNVLLDLNTLAATPITAEIGSIVRASSDGTHVYGVNTNISSADVFALDLKTLTSTTNRFGFMFWSNLAVAPDGSGFVGIRSEPDYLGYVVAPIDPALHLLNFNVYPEASEPLAPPSTGPTYSPGGKVVVTPLTDSIEFWDARFATLRGRLMTPEPLTLSQRSTTMQVPTITLDGAGQTIYAISKSGITVMRLPESVDSMPTYAWPNLGSAPSGANGSAHSGTRKIQSATRITN